MIGRTTAADIGSLPLYDRPAFRRASGPTLRPGGAALTRRALDLGRELCCLPSDGRVLDAGCGTGATSALCAAMGFVPLGVDLRPDLSTGGEETAFPVLRADIRRLPLTDAVCDAVLCECVLSLLDDPDAALAELRRVLRPGGPLLLTDLYLRTSFPPSSRAGMLSPQMDSPGRSCLDGAAPWPLVRERLTHQGFRVRCMEDHSRALAELAARCLFQGQSLCDLGLPCGGGDARRFGYLLVVADSPA